MALGILCLLFAVALTFIQVLTRNTIQTSFTWAEELTRYVVIYAVYFASGSVLYLDMNARVDIFYNMFSPKIQCVLTCIFYLLTAAFLVIMGYYGYVYVERNMTIWCASVHIPWAVPFASLLVGAVNMLLPVPAKLYQTVQDFSQSQQGGEPA